MSKKKKEQLPERLLDGVKVPADIRGFSAEELKQLATTRDMLSAMPCP